MFLENRYINYVLKTRNFRREIMFAVSTLVAVGILFVYDVSSVYAWWNYSDAMFFLKRHCLFVLTGFLAMLMFMRINLEFLRKNSKVFLVIGALALLFVFLFGKETGGAKRWFHLFGFSFQPSEFVKIIYIIYAADFLSRKKSYMRDFFIGIFPLLLVTGLLAGLIIIEPDLGNSALLCFLMFALLFVAHIPKRYIILFLVAGIILLTVMIVISPYRMARVMSFLDPWADAKGKGFQLVQSHIALGSGGLWGRGLGESVQKLFFLPAVHTDFIYAIIGEELGLLGCTAIMFLYVFIFVMGLRVLRSMREGSFNYYLGLGVLLVYTIEALLNMAVVTGLMPTKGLPLPFISYGGSATIANFVMLGLFLNATKEMEYM